MELRYRHLRVSEVDELTRRAAVRGPRTMTESPAGASCGEGMIASVGSIYLGYISHLTRVGVCGFARTAESVRILFALLL